MNKTETTTDILLADIMLRLNVLEKLLISKNIINQDEFTKELETMAKKITEIVLRKANEAKDLPGFISSIEDANKKIN